MTLILAFVAGAVTAVLVPKVFTFVQGVIAKVKSKVQ